MFHALKDKISRARFAARTDRVFESAPIALEPQSGLIVVSQLQHKDIGLYLLAAKSFCRRIPVRRLQILNDGSLTAGDEALLRRHIPGCEITPIARFSNPHCPKGGTWERLLAITTLVPNGYVIQLDSDTLSIGPMEEVVSCIATGTAFTLGTWRNQRVESMVERYTDALKLNLTSDAHIQMLAEANLNSIGGFASLSYIRGCSGFAGFPRNGVNVEFIERVSREMASRLGPKWSAWGSEQFMSNIVVANAPRKCVLPFPKYADCSEPYDPQVTSFIHFVGSCRFREGLYARLAGDLAAGLPRDPGAPPPTPRHQSR